MRKYGFDVSWLLLWGTFSSVWCVTAASRLSATYDEPFYVQAGLETWRAGSFKSLVDVGTAPLPPWVNMSVLHLLELQQGRPFDPATELDSLLPIARATALVFWWLLLGYALVAGRQIAGPWGGRLAVMFLCLEPNFLAHASLATSEIAVCACLLAFFVHYRSGFGRGWGLRVVLPGVWFALAILAKVSGLVFGIFGMIVLEIAYHLRQRSDLAGWRSYGWAVVGSLYAGATRRRMCQVIGIGLVLTFVFCGSDWKPSPSFVKWAHSLPEGTAGDSARWFAEHLTIFSNAGNAIMYQIRRNTISQQVYLFGEAHKSALWYYFPVALSIKTTLPLLLLPCALAVLAPRSLKSWILAIAALLLLYSTNCRVQLGVRLLLPMLTLAIVGLGAALAQALSSTTVVWRQRSLQAVAAATTAWMLWACCSIWPDGLCYVNEMWGGPREGHKLLSGADYDWGQGVKELLDWQRQKGVDSIDVLYFGADPGASRPPLRSISVFSWETATLDNLRADSHAPYLAVSTTLLYGVLDNYPRFVPLLRSLREVRPIDRTRTFLIYDLHDADPRAKAR